MIIGERKECKLQNIYMAETLIDVLSGMERYNNFLHYTALIVTKDMYEALSQVCNHYVGLDDCNLAKRMPLETLCSLRVYICDDYCNLVGRNFIAVNKDI